MENKKISFCEWKFWFLPTIPSINEMMSRNATIYNRETVPYHRGHRYLNTHSQLAAFSMAYTVQSEESCYA
ncbi:hypothetical protein TNCT_483701 [Trichonephila clavata]|uniref:Uncharacterized protein n=1 Tax=Trichonephila clavata TaxID=2740835 RepID=A0A8X6JLG4_TRICU|nr:hypothetical protein TNCT_483701 [Trichonephila clavata]